MRYFTLALLLIALGTPAGGEERTPAPLKHPSHREDTEHKHGPPKKADSREELVSAFGERIGWGPVESASFRRFGREIFSVWYDPFSGRNTCFLHVYYYDPEKDKGLLFIDRVIDGSSYLSTEMPTPDELIIKDAKGKIVIKQSVAHLPARKWYQAK